MRCRPLRDTNGQRVALGHRFEELLEPQAALAAIRRRVPLGSPPRRARCSPVRDPGNRFVVRVDIEMIDGTHATYALKGYADGLHNGSAWASRAARAERIGEFYRAASSYWGEGGESCPVLRPCGYIREANLLIMPWVHGISLAEAVGDARVKIVEHAIAHAPQTLAQLHAARIAPEAPATAQKMVRFTGQRWALYCERFPEARKLAMPLVDSLQAALRHLERSSAVLVHGDPGPRNFLLDGERWLLLDLDAYGYADPAHDVGCLLARLEDECLAAPAFEKQTEQLLSGMRDSCLQAMPDVSGRNVDFFYALALIRGVLTRLVEVPAAERDAHWSELAAHVVERARAALSAVCPESNGPKRARTRWRLLSLWKFRRQRQAGRDSRRWFPRVRLWPLPRVRLRPLPRVRLRPLPRVRLRPLQRVMLLPLLIGLAGMVWYHNHNGNPAQHYLAATVERGDVEDTVSALGTLQPVQYVDVGTQVTGQLKTLHVSVGQQVRKGELVAEIDPTLFAARVATSEASLQSTEAQLSERLAAQRLAGEQYERNRQLFARDAVSQELLEQSQAALEQATAQTRSLRAQVKQFQAQLEGDRANLRYTKIFAPMTGTVVALNARQGQTLVSSQQAPVLMRIADLSTMTVWAQVSEADVPKIAVHMPVYFSTLGLPNRRWHSTVQQVLPTPENVNNVILYDVLFDASNPDGALQPGMSAQASFVVAAARNELVVPISALQVADAHRKGGAPNRDPRHLQTVPAPGQRSGKRSYTVRVLQQDGRIEERPVKVGVMSRIKAEITAGLTEGEKVIIGTQERGKQPARSALAASPGRI
jgi:macrolide-specific efflux system membrane fusion protein